MNTGKQIKQENKKNTGKQINTGKQLNTGINEEIDVYTCFSMSSLCLLLYSVYPALVFSIYDVRIQILPTFCVYEQW